MAQLGDLRNQKGLAWDGGRTQHGYNFQFLSSPGTPTGYGYLPKHSSGPDQVGSAWAKREGSPTLVGSHVSDDEWEPQTSRARLSIGFFFKQLFPATARSADMGPRSKFVQRGCIYIYGSIIVTVWREAQGKPQDPGTQGKHTKVDRLTG
ncbi:uncharacterized protein CLUP02_10106 [Colletotrichum lupini]|uniref:Uncharacterized protein n=1 Tax=Colletotrichum lupini TaxID=145971 RepID=A0A9Q8WIG4_9PEZI|nr:uncharacterized protein CLUP02_10106 [Colletotrichum lupini]UQC84609.1 hypothetical protein CLUP02_10106 [Colletotrichum lupini]